MSTREKATQLLNRLYLMRKAEFTPFTVDDILRMATDKEINFYYYWICGVRR